MQLVDISVGSVGSKKGYSPVIVRSKTGEKLIKNLDVTNQTVAKESKFKRE